MTQQEKIVMICLLAALLLGTAVRAWRRGGADLPDQGLKSPSLSP